MLLMKADLVCMILIQHTIFQQKEEMEQKKVHILYNNKKHLKLKNLYNIIQIATGWKKDLPPFELVRGEL